MDTSRTSLVVSHARHGSETAWRSLYLRFSPIVRSVLRARFSGMVRKDIDLDDCMQQAFFRATQELHTYEDRGRGSFASWIVTVATRRSLDLLRSRSPQPQTGTFSLLLSSEKSPSTCLAESELSQRLASLPLPVRRMVQNRLEARSWRATAREEGLHHHTAQRRCKEALAYLLD